MILGCQLRESEFETCAGALLETGISVPKGLRGMGSKYAIQTPAVRDERGRQELTHTQRHEVTMCRFKLNAGACHRANFETPKHLPVRTLG